MVKKLLVLLILLGGFIFVYFRYFHSSPPPVAKNPVPDSQIHPGVSYVATDKSITDISIFSDKIITPTRLKLSPDGQYLFVTNLTGSLYYFSRKDSSWDPTPHFLTSVDTHFPGFPPEEAGLTGFVFSSNFNSSGKLFLLYSYSDKGKLVKNRVAVTTISGKGGSLSATPPRLIFQANFDGSPSHQITDGLGVDLGGTPHLLILIGEGFDATRAQNPHLEGGKVLLLKEDGSNPLGNRPFPENPKVQALGIRNAFVLAPVPGTNRVLIGDTGPDKYDRLIYLPLPTFDTNPPLNLNWDGNQDKLLTPIPDPTNPLLSDLVIHRLPNTRTFTGFAFLPLKEGKAPIFLATMFGQTGSPNNQPGKEIWLGTLNTLSTQPKVTFKTLITRVKDAEGKLGNPLGMTLDSDNKFFFADVLESRIYLVTTNFEGR